MAAAAKDWKAWAGALGPLGGFLVAAADMPEPVLWGLAFAICALSTAGAFMLVRKTL